MHSRKLTAICLSLPVFLVLASGAVQARPLGGAYDSWGQRGTSPLMSARDARRNAGDEREGRVSSAQFAAEGAEALLGQGAIRITSLPDSTPEGRERLTYEAAMVDRLVMAGYDTMAHAGPPTGPQAAISGQIAEISVRRLVVEPAEQKTSPVSGATSVTVSNRGSSVGMALNLDFSDPRAELMATHMQLQIKDSASGEVLWESRAQITTRGGDSDWNEDRIANTLAAELMKGFPSNG